MYRKSIRWCCLRIDDANLLITHGERGRGVHPTIGYAVQQYSPNTSGAAISQRRDGQVFRDQVSAVKGFILDPCGGDRNVVRMADLPSSIMD